MLRAQSISKAFDKHGTCYNHGHMWLMIPAYFYLVDNTNHLQWATFLSLKLFPRCVLFFYASSVDVTLTPLPLLIHRAIHPHPSSLGFLFHGFPAIIYCWIWAAPSSFRAVLHIIIGFFEDFSGFLAIFASLQLDPSESSGHSDRISSFPPSR